MGAALVLAGGVLGTRSSPVVLTAPSRARTGNPVTLSASVEDSVGAIARVEFYEGATLIDSKDVAPYETSWTPASAGVYHLAARAVDAHGKSALSRVARVTAHEASGR